MKEYFTLQLTPYEVNLILFFLTNSNVNPAGWSNETREGEVKDLTNHIKTIINQQLVL